MTPALRGDVGHRRDLHPARDPGQAQALAHQLVLDLIHPIRHLGAGVADADVVIKPLLDDDVNILVNRGGQDRAAALGVVPLEVGAAAREGDSKGCLRDDHGRRGSSECEGI